MVQQELNLKEIHDRMFTKLKLQQRANKDNNTAMQIQVLLTELKSRSQNNFSYQHPVNQALQEQADLIIQQATSMLNTGRKRELSLSSLFRRKHDSVNTYFGGDDIFEEELAAVISSIESKATGKFVDLKTKLAGKDPLNIEIENIKKEVINAMNKQTDLHIKETTKDVKKIQKKSGKTDVLGTTSTYEGVLDPAWERLFYLFQGKTFSVKNYSSYNKDIVRIKLGSTTYEKAILGSLGALGYSIEDRERIFMQGLQTKTQASSVAEHFYHLQYGYELMGLGLGSKQNNEEFKEAQQVDFFIYNDPNSNIIRVRSTAQMLLNVLNNKQNAMKLMRSINISTNKL